jgi:hypothetical protein
LRNGFSTQEQTRYTQTTRQQDARAGTQPQYSGSSFPRMNLEVLDRYEDRLMHDEAIARAEEEYQRRLAEETEEGESALLLSETDLF